MTSLYTFNITADVVGMYFIDSFGDCHYRACSYERGETVILFWGEFTPKEKEMPLESGGCVMVADHDNIRETILTHYARYIEGA